MSCEVKAIEALSFGDGEDVARHVLDGQRRGAIGALADAAVVWSDDGVMLAKRVNLRTPAFADDAGALQQNQRRASAFTKVVNGGVRRLELSHCHCSIAKTAKIAKYVRGLSRDAP